jgi:WD40 repeat protein/Tfp pilus assembly protein PilF
MSDPAEIQSPPFGTAGPSDPACRLSSLWRRGQHPKVEDFLARAGISDPAVVVTVLRVDQWERRRRGQLVPAESYLEAFPPVREEPEHAIDLVFAEYLMREQLGESPTFEEYARRFPQYADQLKLQVELHQAMEEQGAGEWRATWGEGQANPSANRRTESAATSSSDSMDHPNIPGYEVLGILGWGGMGVVYRAWQHQLNRMVALKMVHAGAQASPPVLARFRVEAEAVARLQHPNIVQIHEVGQHAGCPFLVLELVEGRTLAQCLAGTPQSSQGAAEAVETMARAIQSAHRQGVVHRDLTPANILLTADGVPKITDFGLAKLVIGGENLRTQTGELLGTPSYMAPEQAASRHHDVGAATDIYALGAVLYEMLTGRPPFKAESPIETLRQVVADEPVSPSRLRPKLARDLETICLKCLRKEPNQRYATAGALADELKRFLEGRPILARRASLAERLWRWCRRNPWLAGANIAAAAMTTILAVGATVAALTFRDQRDQIAEDVIRIGRAEAETRRNLFDTLTAQARAGRLSRRAGQRFDSLDALARAGRIGRGLNLSAERLGKLRDEAIACMALPDLKRIKQWGGWNAATVAIAYDADFERYAQLRRDGSVSIRRVADDQEILHLAAHGFRPRLSFDGRYLAVEDLRNYLEIWSLERQTKVATYHDQRAWDLSPDGRLIAIGHVDGSLVQYDLRTGRAERTWTGMPIAHKLAFGPDGRELALITADCSLLQIHDAVSGRVVAQAHVRDADFLAWHPDGTTVATSGHDSRVSLWDIATRSRKMVLECPNSGGIEVAFSPSGDTLVSWGWNGKIRLWDPQTGKLLLSMSGYCHHPVFRRDGRLLAAHDENSQIGLWQVASRREFRTLVRDSYHDNYWKISVHPAGRLLAAGMESGVGLWDLASGADLGFLPIGSMKHILFDPAGSLLARGPNGVWRLAIHEGPTPAALRMGLPRALALPGSDTELALSRDNRLLALASVNDALVVDVDRPDRRIRLGPHGDLRYVDVSPDGRWVATGSHHEPGVRIWQARDGELVAELPSSVWSPVAFSPDGRWVAAGHIDCRVWSVASWSEGARIGGALLGFSPDGMVLAVETGAGAVRLVNPATGRDYARLEDPNQERATHIGFSPDGAQLAAASADSAAIHIWDLRAIRRNLAAMGLDWHAPPYPDSDPPDPALSSLTSLQVDLGPFQKARDRSNPPPEVLLERFDALLKDDPEDAGAYHLRALILDRLQRVPGAIADFSRAIERRPKDAHLRAQRGRLYEILKQYEPAIADLEMALDLDPDHAQARAELHKSCNNRAWELATGPEPRRELVRALKLARRAMNLIPGQGFVLNTLGVVQYRLGRNAEAIMTLEQRLAAGRNQANASDFFFLAMAHARLEHRDQARECFAHAVKWLNEQKDLSAQVATELAAFRAEAEGVMVRLLGELPADLFARPSAP